MVNFSCKSDGCKFCELYDICLSSDGPKIEIITTSNTGNTIQGVIDRTNLTKSPLMNNY